MPQALPGPHDAELNPAETAPPLILEAKVDIFFAIL